MSEEQQGMLLHIFPEIRALAGAEPGGRDAAIAAGYRPLLRARVHAA